MDRQTEDFLQILQLIDLKGPLNNLGGWAASADFIKSIYKELVVLLEKNDELTIIECGSGVSTILLGLFLKKHAPKATLITLDHDYNFYLKSLQELKLHDLQNVQLIYAPLKPYKIENKIWLWYDISAIRNVKTVDFLIVDGPPMAIQSEARYPALPLLKSKFSDSVVIILDDAARDDERKIVEKWKKEISFTEEYIENEKGTSILRSVSLKRRPLVSIAIPTYNRLGFLKEAVSSALTQTYENIEILIYDDGSKYDIESELKKIFCDERIKFFKNETNKGRPYTRNRLIEKAEGEYILWLDDDDQLLSNCIMEYMVVLNSLEYEPDVIYGNLEIFGTTKSQLYPLEFYENPILMGYLLYTKAGSPIPNPSTMVRKTLYEKYGKYDEECIRAQDYEFWCRIWDKAIFKKVDKEVARYRVHGENVSAFGILSADRSYESYAIRKNLNENVLKIAFNDIEQKFVFSSLANLLQIYLDYTNALFYLITYCEDFYSAKKVVMQIADEAVMNWFSENIMPLEMKKDLKKLLKLLHRNALDSQLLEKIYTKFGHSWIYHFASGKYYMSFDREKAYQHIRASLLINPFSHLSLEFMDDLGKSREAQKIVGRLEKNLNNYEKNKTDFFREVFFA